jgi:farnesyl-diphosphate farnesyltransferase
MTPKDLQNPASEPAFRPLYDSLLEHALGHLRAGWRYTNQIPRGQIRLRLACAWPVLLGVRTLAKLRREDVLDPTRRIKVTRPEVRSILLGTVARLPLREAWERQFDAALL